MGPPERSSRSAITGNRAGPLTIRRATRPGSDDHTGRNPRTSGTHEAHGTGQGDDLSKSVAKALHGGIGREKKRGISTFLFRRSGSIGAFATDLDIGRDRPRWADVGLRAMPPSQRARPRAASEGASRAPRGPVMWCPRRTIMSRFDNNGRRRSGRRDESLVTDPGVNRAIPGRVIE